jgi:uncharacterized repeat protein (TIGR03987 family)
MLKYAIFLITLALVFYTTGVFAEKLNGVLKKWHVIIFWFGLIFDFTATTLMGNIANSGPILSFNSIHGITGIIAILLMLFHALWASFVMYKNNENLKLSFHKFSILVWLIWLIPYLSGVIYGISR